MCSSDLSRWESGDEPLFLDADADAFQVVLSCMRTSCTILPEKDPALCKRVLLLAEFLGIDNLLAEVKATTYANLHPPMKLPFAKIAEEQDASDATENIGLRLEDAGSTGVRVADVLPGSLAWRQGVSQHAEVLAVNDQPVTSVEDMEEKVAGQLPPGVRFRSMTLREPLHPQAAAAFDERFSSLAEAFAQDVLPARFFAPEPLSSQPPPGRKIKQLMTAAPGTVAKFYDVDDGLVSNDDTADYELPVVRPARFEPAISCPARPAC